MADNDYLGDSRVAQFGGATPEQVETLRRQYQPGAGAATRTDSTGRPTTGAKPKKEVPLVGKEAAAKTFQSATFGFGADIVGAITSKQNEQTIREMAKNYDDEHPLAGFGIDLATAVGTSLIPGAIGFKGAEVGATGIKMLAKAGATGAAVGAATGAGAGGDIETRAKNAAKGALMGGVFGAGAGYVGSIARPLAEKIGLASANKSAANEVLAALKKEGKTAADLDAFLKANPGARIADFSDKVADVVAKVGGLSNDTSRAVSKAAGADKELQQRRLMGEVSQAQPLQKTKQDMIDNIDKVSRQMKDTYTLSKTESVAVTPELQRILDHPEVKPLLTQALKDFGAGKQAGIKDLVNAPKPNYSGRNLTEIPSAMLDDLQKAVGKAAEDEGVGSIRYGTLSAAQRALKDQQTGTIVDAQKLAARLGGEKSETGILGAQAWGHGYAFGLKNADIEAFRSMDPEQKEYAKLGMLDGLEKYLTDVGRMTEGSLTKIADKLRDPKVEEVLGKKAANDVRKVFVKESARAKITASMESGGSRRAAFNEENEKRMLAHAANVAVGGASHLLGTGVRLLTAHGMSEKQAQSVIQIAMQPGGAAKLKQMGMDQRLLDALGKLLPFKGYASGKIAEEQNARASQ